MKKFNIEISNNFEDYSRGTWKIILQRRLDDHSDKQNACGVPIIENVLPEFEIARFVRFYVVEYYGDGAALQYFKIE